MVLERLNKVKTVFGLSVLFIVLEDLLQVYNMIGFVVENPGRDISYVFRNFFPAPLIFIILSIIGAATVTYIYYKVEQ